MKDEKDLDFFSKYLSIWVAICIVLGTGIGYFFPSFAGTLGQYELANVSIPIAIVLLIMMYPIMLKISFEEILKVKDNKKPLYLTVLINWGIKPFTMTAFAWLFIHIIFGGIIPVDLQSEYIAGLIILGLAPCTAMVLVWTHLANSNINYALVQVSVNNLIILLLFAPLGAFLVGQTTDFPIPVRTIFYSVLFYVALPLVLAIITRYYTIHKKGIVWFENKLLKKIEWVTPVGLLVTLILIFTLQGEMILNYPLHIALIAIPIIIQTYFIFTISYFGAKKLKIPFNEAAPSSFIAPSNFFELAVATTLILFGAASGATLATVVGVLVEVPVMLSLVKIMKRNKDKFQFESAT
ncbi:ACR3 family arsenite efflux transporter [Methanosalsum natronophilum]|uniref:Arsenical-resistance protein n=1 Tax=Methanosalsum natronophilum TaxID=768733 RepID=A0A424Z469_9EURY|nr:ACR3 family arsenite efflux transporter [Methanosalsum natronophilum]MCS3924035.1 ACR3 family arsenite transporter [Methanosalsum natronophilum]RQD89580.1 MAG: arsenical-resistance protein [Methanosalsum natronophilum]